MKDTIAAIATGLSRAGISIIRISGPEAAAVASRLFRVGKKDALRPVDVGSFDSHTVHYGFIVDGAEVIDEVMLLYLKGPRTFTTEETVEIDCHGGILVTKKILSAVLKNGARLAEPGEFTKRAFENGRIDLSQAEAVMDVIAAGNDLALKNSVRQLRGSLRTRILAIRDEILSDVATIEAALDQPEYYSLEGFSSKLLDTVTAQQETISKLIRSFDDGRMLSEGIKTVILGKPNVGKSSLMNLLLGEDRAIVTDIAGTTRDVLSEEMRLNGIPLILIDTAGIHETADPVEQIGVNRAKGQAEEADLILYVADASEPLTDEDEMILRSVTRGKIIPIRNKTDLTVRTDEETFRAFLTRFSIAEEPVSVSAKEGSGLTELSERISELFFKGCLEADDEIVITSERQKECLNEAYESLSRVRESLASGMPEDFLSIDLMGAYGALSRILGEDADEDLINRIFSQFCLGK